MKLSFAAVLLSLFAASLSAQVAPSMQRNGVTLTAGIGFSDWNQDYGNGDMQGGAIWLDGYPNMLPGLLDGLGVEIEARDISLNQHPGQNNLRTDTVSGGLIYEWMRPRHIRPYAKALMGFGSIDFDIGSPGYTHDTRTVYTGGAGIDIKLPRRLWIRGDYEYESWPDMFRKHNSLNPNGFTIGVAYNFARPGMYM